MPNNRCALLALLLTIAVFGVTASPTPGDPYGNNKVQPPFVYDAQGNRYISQRGMLDNESVQIHDQVPAVDRFLHHPTKGNPVYPFLQREGYVFSDWPVLEAPPSSTHGQQQGVFPGHVGQQSYRQQQAMNGYSERQAQHAMKHPKEQSYGQYSGQGGQKDFRPTMSNQGYPSRPSYPQRAAEGSGPSVQRQPMPLKSILKKPATTANQLPPQAMQDRHLAHDPRTNGAGSSGSGNCKLKSKGFFGGMKFGKSGKNSSM